MKIFNTHSHLQDKDDLEIKNILEITKEYNVSDICVIGYDFNSSKRALEVARQYPNIYAVCGLQPEEVSDFDGNFDKFIELFDDEKCVCIGEIGLDYYYGKETKDKQLECFEKQLQIACNYKKPIEIHCRDAYEDTYNLLAKYKDRLDGIIMHCYSGSKEMAQRFLKLGAYLSISGVVTFKNAKEIKDVVLMCPMDRLLVETDDPYLTPVPFRGKENNPAYVYYVVKEIANLKQMDEQEVASITYANAKKVFHL